MTIRGTQRRSDPGPSDENARQRADRLATEAAMLAAATADLEAGRYLDGREAEAWLDGWERGEAVALPDAPSRRANADVSRARRPCPSPSGSRVLRSPISSESADG